MQLPKSKWPCFNNDIIRNVSRIIASGRVNSLYGGYWCKKFEREFSDYHDNKYSVAVSNGTVGLELALASLSIQEKSEVIVTPRTYYSSVSCIVKNNLTPIFADIDIKTHNICPKDIKKKITKKTKCIICVHLGGVPCDMKEITKIAKEHNLYVIEDCSQAHGAKIGKKIVGSFGDVAVWSFCNDKIISTLGEGGMVSTKRKSLYKKLWSLKDIGKNYDKFYGSNANTGFQWLHDYIGTNARMTEIQACSGYFQLKNLDKTLKIRNKNANFLKSQLNKTNAFIFIEIPKNYYNAYYRLNFMLKKSFNRDKFLKDLEKKNFSKSWIMPNNI